MLVGGRGLPRAAEHRVGARVPGQDRADGQRGAERSPPNIQLTYDEAVEPRFAIISVTNAAGQQETTGPVAARPPTPTR